MSLIHIEIEGHVATLTIDNPAKRNALSEPLIHDMIEGLEDLKEKKIRAVILRAKPGIKVWSAGHDVSELPLSRRDPLGWDDPLRQIIRELEHFPAPVIAMIEGSVWGGACEMVLACDMVVAAPDSTFAITPARLGVPYNISGVLNFLNATSHLIVREMVFTAQPVSAIRAERLGMINHIVEIDELEPFCRNIAETIARNSPLSIAVIKEELRLLESARAITPPTFERIQGLRRMVYDSEDYREGITAFLEKRPADFKGR